MAGNMDVTIIMRAVDQASGAIRSIQGSLGSLDGSLRAAETGSKMLAGALAGLGLAGLGVLKTGLDNNAMLEAQEIKWTQLTGSTEGAKDAMAQFLAVQKESPFDNKSIDSFVTSLYSTGVPFDQAINDYKAVGNTAAAFGLTQEQLDRALIGVGQAMGKGKLQAEEMNQIQEAGIPIASILGDMMGKTAGEIREMGAEGLITKDIMDEAFLYMGEKYGGSMEAFSNTWTGIWGRAKEAFQNFAGLLTADIFEGIKGAVGPLVTRFEELNAKFREMREAGKSTMDILKGLIPPDMEIKIWAATGAIAMGLVPALYSVAGGVWAAMAPLLPFLAAGALLGALAFTIYKNWATFKPFFSGIFNAVKPMVVSLANTFKTSFSQLIGHAKPIWNQLKELMKSLKPVIDLVVGVLKVLGAAAAIIFNGIVRAIGPLIKAFISILDVVANVVGAVVKYLYGDMVGAQKAWDRAVKSTQDVVKHVWSAIKGFISGAGDAILGILRGLGKNVPATMGQAFEAAKSAVMRKLAELISNIAGYAGRFMTAGRGLIDAFKKGISGALESAKAVVSGGMKAIRSLLPGSDAKEGPLSDLTKSGAALFPTFAKGIARNAGDAAMAAKSGIKDVAAQLSKSDLGETAIFNGGVTTIKHSFTMDISGKVQLEGDSGKKDLDVVANQIGSSITEHDFLRGLRQEVRKR